MEDYKIQNCPFDAKIYNGAIKKMYTFKKNSKPMENVCPSVNTLDPSLYGRDLRYPYY